MPHIFKHSFAVDMYVSPQMTCFCKNPSTHITVQSFHPALSCHPCLIQISETKISGMELQLSPPPQATNHGQMPGYTADSWKAKTEGRNNILCYMDRREGDAAENLNIRSSRGASEYSLIFQTDLPCARVQFIFSNCPAGRPSTVWFFKLSCRAAESNWQAGRGRSIRRPDEVAVGPAGGPYI